MVVLKWLLLFVVTAFCGQAACAEEVASADTFGIATDPEEVRIPPPRDTLERFPEELTQLEAEWARQKAQAERPRIALVTFNSQERYLVQRQGGYNTKACYSALHGYSWFLDFNQYEGSGWYAKCRVLLKYLETDMYDWVVWTDSDVIITNFTMKLEWFLEPAADGAPLDIVFTDHSGGVNSGVFMVKNTDFALKFLRDWIKFEYDGYAWQDNGSLFTHLLRTLHQLRGEPYDDECHHPRMRSVADWLVPCFNRRMTALGYEYPRGDLPHFRFVDPNGFQVPAKFGGGLVRGGFNVFNHAEITDEVGLRLVQHWGAELFWQPGQFMLHVGMKYFVNTYVPAWLASECSPRAIADYYAHIRNVETMLDWSYCRTFTKGNYIPSRPIPGDGVH